VPEPGKQMEQNQQNKPEEIKRAGYTERIQPPAKPTPVPSGNNLKPQRGLTGAEASLYQANNADNVGHTNTPPVVPRRFRNYDLVSRIGIGGMGEVYLARQRTAFGREVAVKIIRSDLMNDITVRKRFLREAEVSAYLKHDHILPMVEFDEEQGRLFLVTPYIKGGTLAKRLKEGSLSLSETQELFTTLVKAVAYLHKRGVVHRDLKPSNIMLDCEEGSERVYVRLIDFGIASLQGQVASAPLTTAGHEMGTLAYMAPERLDGVAAPSNDIYSLGVILYQMLTGRLPEDEVDTMLPDPLADVVKSSTAPNPTQRYPSADDLLKAFEMAYQSLSLSHFRASSANPETPLPGQNTSIPPVSHPSRIPPKTSVVSPITSNRSHEMMLKKTTNMEDNRAQNSTARWENEGGEKPVSIAQPMQTLRPQPSSLRSEVVLSSGKGFFQGEDYEAPTSYLNPQQSQKLSASSQGPSNHSKVVQNGKARSTQPMKKRGFPIVTVISVVILVIVFVIGSIAYSIFQSLNTATVTVMPRIQTVSSTFDLTAKLGQQNLDMNAGIIPARIISSTKSASQQGTTTGRSSCKFLLLDCKQSVSPQDVTNLAAQIRPQVITQITQDIHQQEQTLGATPVGDIVFANEQVTSDPQERAESKTVKVTVSLQGAQEYIKASDARTVAMKMLQNKLAANYSLIQSTVQFSQPVIMNVTPQRDVKIKIAAGGVSRYNMPPSTIADIQKQIAGKSQQDARLIIAQNHDLDPNNISFHLAYGDTFPTNTQQITINQSEPTSLPNVQLTAIPKP
jgi:serine/threonine protein kinase